MIFLLNKCYNIFMIKIETKSSEETQQLAGKIAKKLFAGATILLSGDLGAGKTCFTQGLAKGLGIKRVVNSPTFTILKIYKQGVLPLYHIDAYRLSDGFQDVGFSEVIEDDGVVVIEWAEYLKELLPKNYLKITIKWIDENTRILEIEASGEKYQEIIEGLV